MAFKCVILAALVAVANAGYLGAPAAVGYASPLAYASPLHATAVGSQTQSVVRSADGNSAISTYSKAVDTAYSSVRKYDQRISNDAIVAAPAYAHSYAAPAIASYAAPAYTQSYAAPIASYAAPALRAPLAYAAGPAIAKVASPVGLGVAYSAAPVVSHVSLDGLGAHYVY